MHNVSLAWKNIISRKKQTVRIITFLSVAMCLLISTILVEKGVSAFMNRISVELPSARLVRSGNLTQEGVEKLHAYYEKDERVEDVVVSKKSFLSVLMKNSKEMVGEEWDNCGLLIYPYHKGIHGYTEYTDTLNEGEVLLPRYISPDISQGSDNILTYEFVFLDTSEWIGKELKCETFLLKGDMNGNIVSSDEKIEFSLKIVGTYDNMQTCHYQNEVYVSEETLNNIYTASMAESCKNSLLYDSESMMILLKTREYAEEVAEESGFQLMQTDGDDSRLYLFFINGLKISAIVMFVAALFNIVLTLTEEIRERRSEIALLRAMGYLDEKISKMFLIELLMIMGMTILVSVVFSWMFVHIGNWVIAEFIGTAYRQVKIVFDVLYVAKVIGVCVIAVLVTFAGVYYKMEQVNTIEALKEE